MTEPDARFSLAAERTHLAYVRTSLAFFAGALAVWGYAEQSHHHGALTYLTGGGMFAIGLVVLVGGHLRVRSVSRALRAGEPLPTTRLTGTITWLIVAVAVFGALAVRFD